MKPKDIEIVLEISPSYARSKLRLLKRIFNKEKHQQITIKEFCRYEGFEVDDVIERLKNDKK